MHTLCATLKQLRLDSHLTQSELYGGIVSRSFAGRLERGEHDIAVEKFFQILNRLHVTADEFRFVQQDYQPTAATLLKSRTHLAYEQENFPWLHHLEQRYHHSLDPQQQELATVADILLKSFGSANWQITPAMEQLWQRMTDAPTWHLYDLDIANAWLSITYQKHDNATLLAGIAKMHASSQRYLQAQADPFHVIDTRASFDLVALQILFWNHQYTEARAFRQQLLPENQPNLGTDGALTIQVCLCLWEWFFGDQHAGDLRADRLMAISWIPAAANIHSLLASYQEHARHFREKHPEWQNPHA